MPAIRVFAPPADRVGELFAGPQHASDRKQLEQEKKKAYAAELQAQMQAQQAQKQQERLHRFGAGAQHTGTAPQGKATTSAAADYGSWTSAAEPAQAAGADLQQDAMMSSGLPMHTQMQQQAQQLQYQQPTWPTASSVLGTGHDSLQPPGSNSSSSPPPWLQHTLQQQQQLGYGSNSLLQQPQQPYGGWPLPQQTLLGAPAWAGAAAGPGAGLYGPSAYTSAAIAPSYHSMGSSYTDSMSPGARGFQAGAQAAAAIAAMQAAAGRSAGPVPTAGSWGLGAPAAAEPTYMQQQAWGHNAMSSGNPAAAAGSAAPAAGGGTSLSYLGGGSNGSNAGGGCGSPPTGRGVQDKARKDAYRAELEAQIRERAEQKAADKAQRAAVDARKEAEIAAYCPWGRAGAGAPLRDASGQAVTSLRGIAQQDRQQVQQLQQWQQQQDQQQRQQQQYEDAAADAAAASPRHSYQQQNSFQQQNSLPRSSPSPVDHGMPQSNGRRKYPPDFSQPQQQQYQQQQQQQQQPTASSGGPTAAGAGPAPVLCFRSDKAFMTSGEIEAKQRQQRELQLELDRQVQEKKRQKELKKQAEEAEARQEEARLAAEQARLAAQFQSEQDAERGRTNKRGSKGGGEEEQQQGSLSGAGSKSEGRRRVSVLMAGDEPTPPKQDLPSQQSRTTLGMGPAEHTDQFESSAQQLIYGQQQPQQQSYQQQPYQQQPHQQQQQQSYLGGSQLPYQQQQQLPYGMGQQGQQSFLDPQHRQQLLYEALQLESHQAGAQPPSHEINRLRQDMEAQSASLRSAVESQGREMAGLRAIAAAAEAESAAAKAELAQVKRNINHRSQELPHETLSTMLADYGDGPASAIINTAYHPNPIRRIDLELPPSAAALRRSIEAQARAEVGASMLNNAREHVGHVGHAKGELVGSSDLLGSSGSAVDLLESLLQHGKAAKRAGASYPAAAAREGAGGVGRSASVPAGGYAPGWADSVPLGVAGNLRGSMLATESTLIFPAGLQAPAAAQHDPDEQEMGSSSTQAVQMGGSSAWNNWQQPGQMGQVPTTRHTTSAPGYSSSKAGMPLRPTLSFGRGARDGLVTPGGSDLMAVVNRNADKLRVLENMPEAGSSEALDQFLATFAANNSKPKQPSASGSATPVSRLMTPQVRTRPHRYSNTSESLIAAGGSTSHAAAVQPGNSFRKLPDIADTLDLELSKLEVNHAASMGHSAAAAAAMAAGNGRYSSSSSGGYGASSQAQHRLMLAGTAAGIGAAAAAAAAAGGSSRGAAAGLDW